MSLIENKKVGLNYEIIESFEAGLELFGLEVKSLRKKQGSLAGAFITVRAGAHGGEAFLSKAHIPPYQEKNTPTSYDPYRERKLLLKKSQIRNLAAIAEKKGLTIVPISVYSKSGRPSIKNPTGAKQDKDSIQSGGKIKIEIAIVRGKKKFDKRETLKKRQVDRDIAREFNTR